MKVLLVTETLHAGGAETFVLRLCKKLNECGIVCHILNLNPDIENQELLKQYKGLEVFRVYLPFLFLIKKIDSLFFKLNIDFSIQTYLSIRWIEKTMIDSYDVFHAHLIKVDYLLSLIKEKHPDIKVVSTVHGDYSDYFHRVEKGEQIRWLNFKGKLNLIKSQIDKWVVITHEQESFFKNILFINPVQILKLYNGFEAPRPLVKNDGNKSGFVIGMVARGVKLKGWSLLVEAFLRMPSDCQLRLVGIGSHLDELKKEYENNSKIVFVGFHPNPVEEIKDFDVFVLPSLFPYESLPTVIIEALFCGKPVIATRVGEIPEMLRDTDSNRLAGFLLDFDGTKINVDELFRCLMIYYDQQELLAEHSALAYKAFEKFNMKSCANHYVEVYKSLI